MKGASMIKRILHFLLIIPFLLFPCLAFAEEPMPTTTNLALDAEEFKAGEIIVKFKEGIPQAGVQSLLLAENISILDEMDNLGLVLLSVPKSVTPWWSTSRPITSFRLQALSRPSPITAFVLWMSSPMTRIFPRSGTSPGLRPLPLGT